MSTETLKEKRVHLVLDELSAILGVRMPYFAVYHAGGAQIMEYYSMLQYGGSATILAFAREAVLQVAGCPPNQYEVRDVASGYCAVVTKYPDGMVLTVAGDGGKLRSLAHIFAVMAREDEWRL